MRKRTNLNLVLVISVLLSIISAQAIGDGFWPPSDVQIEPQKPTSADVVAITLSGTWPDSCVPDVSYISVEGNDIYFGVIRSFSESCSQELTPWQLTESVGPLSPGTYNLYIALDRGPWTLMTEFYVAEANVYVFVPEQSTIVKSGGFPGVHETYDIEGWFELVVNWDANTASFNQVYGDLYHDGVPLDTTLNIILRMTEMTSTSVSDTVIEFESNPISGGVIGDLTLTFEEGDSVHLTGNFSQALQYPFNYDLDAVASKEYHVYYVDGINGNDDDDGLTPQTAFATIQKGIDSTVDGDIVIALPGTYEERINFLGKNIVLTSVNPSDPEIVRETIITGRSEPFPEFVGIVFRGTENETCTLTGFNIKCPIAGFDPEFDPDPPFDHTHTRSTISYCLLEGVTSPCGGVISYFDGTIANCVIADPMPLAWCLIPAYSISSSNSMIKNCTFKAISLQLMLEASLTIQNCIIYTDSEFAKPFKLLSGATLNISYCNFYRSTDPIHIQGTNGVVNWGPGNINTDPCFVRLGVWDYNEPMTYYPGDYHLKSQGWRWDAGFNPPRWTYDYDTSPCIDAGNPGCPLGDELMTVPPDPTNEYGENIRINMGVCGGTAEASMPPYDWALLADLTNDGNCGLADLSWFARFWLQTAQCLAADLDRNGSVTLTDFALFSNEWQK